MSEGPRLRRRALRFHASFPAPPASLPAGLLAARHSAQGTLGAYPATRSKPAAIYHFTCESSNRIDSTRPPALRVSTIVYERPAVRAMFGIECTSRFPSSVRISSVPVHGSPRDNRLPS